jgi:hypothetical protein
MLIRVNSFTGFRIFENSWFFVYDFLYPLFSKYTANTGVKRERLNPDCCTVSAPKN